ncbi:MAG: hypothetical protein ACE5GU_13235 [Candidatus Scalinduaceae bacterium]
MLIINEILGNINTDGKWKKLYNEMSCDNHVQTIMFTRLESERCRLFKRLPELNQEMGINLKRGMVLRDGDVLYYKKSEKMFVAKIEAEKVMVFYFVGKPHEDALFEVAVKLGHVIGNQHWQMKVVGRKIFVPLVIDQKVMESVIKSHNIPGIEYTFEEIDGGQLSKEKYEYLYDASYNHHSHTH